MHQLYELSLGQSLAEEFALMCRTNQDSLIVVPSSFVRDNILRNYSAQAVSMDYLARAIILNNGQEFLNRLSRVAQERIIERIVTELKTKGQLKYFAPLAEEAGFYQSLCTLIDELGRAGMREDSDLFTVLSSWDRKGASGAKDADLCLIYHEYYKVLLEKQLYDVAGLYRVALVILETGKAVIPFKELYFSEFYHFTPLEMELLKALGKDVRLTFALYYETNRGLLTDATREVRDELIGLGCALASYKKKERAVAPALEFFQRNFLRNRESCEDETGVRCIRATSREEEIASVVVDMKKRILSGTKPADILLIVRSLQDYPHLRTTFAECGVPVELPYVTGALAHPLIQLVTAILRSAAQASDVSSLKTLLTNSTLKVLYGIDNVLVAQATTQGYFGSVSSWQEYLEARQEGKELFALLMRLRTSLTAGEFVALWQEELTRLNPLGVYGKLYQEGEITLRELKGIAAALRLINTALSQLALDAQQSGGTSQVYASADFAQLWERILRGQMLMLERPQTGGVKVLEASSVQGVHYPYVYIMGVRDGVFPKVRHENYLYTDRERCELRDLGLEMPVTTQDMAQDAYYFAQSVSCAEREVIFSYYEDDRAGASSYIAELTYLYPNLIAQSKVYLPQLVERYSKQGALRLLTSYAAQKRDFNLLAGQLDAASLLRLRTLCLQQEKTPTGVPHQRHSTFGATSPQPSFSATLNPRFPQSSVLCQRRTTFSATALNQYIACPFAYLATYLWQGKEQEEQDGTMRPEQKGLLIHAALATFLTRYKGKFLGDLDAAALWQELKDIYSSEAQRAVATGKLLVSPYTDAEHTRNLKTLRRFLALEMQCQQQMQDPICLDKKKKQFATFPPFLPVRLEQAFGRGSAVGVSIEVAGEKIFFSGQIDRIDQAGDSIVIYDYKTGTVPSNSELKEGTNVQLAIYALAACQIFGVEQEKIFGAGYIALAEGKRRGGLWQDSFYKKRLPWMNRAQCGYLAPGIASALAEINRAIVNMRQGAFPATPRRGKCPVYCAFKDICRKERSASSETEEG